MPWRLILDSLARHQRGIRIIGGLAALLGGVERLLSPRKKTSAFIPAIAPTSDVRPKKRANYFTIKQTRSELGYVYWVLQGHGACASFTLFDTWQEAADEVARKISQAGCQSEIRELVSSR